MQDGVGLVSGFLVQAFEGLRGGQNDEFDPSLLGLALHRVHDGQGAGESGADEKLSALPGNLLFNGERRVAEFIAEFLGGLLLPFLDLSPIDDHVVHVSLAVNLDRAEREIFDTHGEPRAILLPTRLVVQFERARLAYRTPLFEHDASGVSTRQGKIKPSGVMLCCVDFYLFRPTNSDHVASYRKECSCFGWPSFWVLGQFVETPKMNTNDPFFNLYSHGFARVAVRIPTVRVADPEYNARETIALLKQVAERRALLVVFPELGLSAYSCEDLFQQQALLDGCKEQLGSVLRASQDIPVMAIIGLPLVVDGLLFNCAAVLSRGHLLGVTRKPTCPTIASSTRCVNSCPSIAPDLRRSSC
jgi:Carbon-nitrogen hydrolase